LQIGFPNLVVSFFSALGPIQGHKVPAFISHWGGRLKDLKKFQPRLLV
jgi:hypothetical protein